MHFKWSIVFLTVNLYTYSNALSKFFTIFLVIICVFSSTRVLNKEFLQAATSAGMKTVNAIFALLKQL